MDNNIEPPTIAQTTTPTRMTTFPRSIVDRVGSFSYPPKVGTRRRLGSSSSGSSSCSPSTTQAVAAPPMPTVATPPPQVMAPLPEGVVKFITRTFLAFPEGTHWSPNGVPTITHWPTNLESVVVSLPETKRWAGVNYPIAFPQDSVEWYVAEVFGRLPQYQNIQSPYPHVTGTFFKRTRKRKGAGQDRAYKLEIYTQNAGGLYGKLSANTVALYLPTGSLHAPTSSLHAPTAAVHTSTAAVHTSHGSLVPSTDSTTPQDQWSPLAPSSSSQLEDTHEEVLTDLEKLAMSWERAHIAYYEAMDFKEKVNGQEGKSSASSIFWAAFEDFYEEVVNNPNDDSEFLNVCMGLMERKKLRRGISISESSLSQILQHQAMSMYNETDFKIEFELHARRFWKQWDELDGAIQCCLPGLERDLARAFVEIHGGPNYMQSEPPRDVDVKKFLENRAFSAFTIQQIRRMCHHSIEDIEEERDLLNKREDMEKALVAYQRLYLSSEIFHEIQAALGSIPSIAIQVTQSKELQAFTRHWEGISCTSEYFYKPIVESFHTLGFEETAAVDMSRITNCWLSNTWKQFWASSFNYNTVFEYPDDMAGKILHPKADNAIVRPDLQLPVAEMIGHLMYLMTLLDIQVTRPFSFATLLLLCNQVPSATDLSSGVDPATRAALEKDFRLGWGATWSLLAPMRTNFQFATDLVTELANNQLGDQLGWTFKNFRLQEVTWKEQVEAKIGAIIYSHLFSGRFEIGKAMRRGFYLGIATSKTSDVKKESMRAALDNLTAESLRVMFSGQNAMEAGEFLNKCIFTNKVPQHLREMFKTCVHQMTYGERSRLAIFITGNEYFGGKIVTVDFVDRNDDPLITASTCFEKLNLPHYKDLDTMYRKICYSTMDRSFGNM